ncbi:hypothetical protein ACIRP0_14035 [Streptomyces sp. NPDC101733]|uniref:hypothetical protein n=1 Tax=unclassified Streptomyces TaxID=2593676 RepID=UPI003809E846
MDSAPDPDPDLDRKLAALARQANLPPDTVTRLLRHTVARREVARLQSNLTSQQVEEILARGAARSLAINSALSPAARIRLAAHPEESVRAALAAGTRDDPPGLLAGLAADPSPLVRGFLAMNRYAPPAVRAALAGDPRAEVRQAIAVEWPDAPEEVRRALLTDPDAGVRGAACRAAPPADLLEALLADPETRASVVRYVDLGRAPEAVAALAADPDADVRAAVARHPDLPGPLNERLAKDPDPVVRAVIARRGDTAPAVRERVRSEIRDRADRIRENPASARDDEEEAAYFTASFVLHAGAGAAPPSPAPLDPEFSTADIEELLVRAGL